MVPEGRSETAFATVSLRALSNREDPEEIRTNDHFADIFIPKDRIGAFETRESREAIKKSLPPGLFEYVIARTKYFDGIFLGAKDIGFKQIVSLGAGYDSRPYRFAENVSDLKIFEVDTPPTQENKVSILGQNKVKIPDNVLFIPVDFEKEGFMDRLLEKGLDPAHKTLFLMEGVSFYLTKEAITGILKAVRENAATGSRLCFDFQTIPDNGRLIDTGLKNENTKFGIRQDAVARLVKDSGFWIVENLDHLAMEDRFLRLRDGRYFGRIAPMMNIILIERSSIPFK